MRSTITAACAYGVDAKVALNALASFEPPKRRLEHLGDVGGVSVYDDFAHHPTAIATTLAGLRAKLGARRIHAVPRFVVQQGDATSLACVAQNFPCLSVRQETPHAE